MQLQPGMRVRCVDDADLFGSLTKGADYILFRRLYYRGGATLVELVEIPDHWFDPSRFKPIVRVKAPSLWANSVLASAWP